MFHQANLRWEGVDKTTLNGVLGQYSLFQMWVETVVAEVTRLVNWPIISLKHDDVRTLPLPPLPFPSMPLYNIQAKREQQPNSSHPPSKHA